MLQNSFWLDRPHVPKGGCKGVIDGLRSDLRENGARVKLSHEITEILPGDAEESTKGNRFCIGIRRRGRDEGFGLVPMQSSTTADTLTCSRRSRTTLR
uniref:Uncharacterized protein n=1 Tax=uncultured marine group II/III euryarchaeote SAT1000_05_B02 TaxID=1456551 RepID=A0A075I0T6_9EURY|nr:hypothetical protein [uncultured marine group II/III euryarchaeote SAT1000_05_B02]